MAGLCQLRNVQVIKIFILFWIGFHGNIVLAKGDQDAILLNITFYPAKVTVREDTTETIGFTFLCNDLLRGQNLNQSVSISATSEDNDIAELITLQHLDVVYDNTTERCNSSFKVKGQRLGRTSINLMIAANFTRSQHQKNKSPLLLNDNSTDNVQYKFVSGFYNQQNDSILNDTVSVITKYDIIVLRQRRTIDSVFRIAVSAFVGVITFLMGCVLDLKIIWQILKKPIPPAIGFTCQFCIMPLVSAPI